MSNPVVLSAMPLSAIIFFLGFIKVVWSLNADLLLHCDNYGTVYESTDNGDTFTQIGYEGSWQNALLLTISDVTDDTILRVECEDVGVVGGFIATIDFDGEEYSTTDPINDGNFELISSSDGTLSPLVYNPKTSSPWNINTEGIADDAVWIWNANTYNTMIFEFRFANIMPTPSPTSCFNAISDWTVDEIGSSSQFRFRSQCNSKQFLKIKMVSLIEYDGDDVTTNKITSFASSNWYWITDQDAEFEGYNGLINKYVSTDTVSDTEIEFNLTTILFYEDGHLEGDGDNTIFFANTLKWSTDINNWPFLKESNTLKLCIDVMTNGGNNNNNNDDTVDDKRFTFNDFEFRLEDKAKCGDDEVDVAPYYYQKNGNHMDICFTFNSCDDVIDHDPMVYHIDQGPNTVNEETNVVVISIGIAVGLLILVIFTSFYFYNKNKKLQNDISLVKDGNDGYDTMVTDA